MTVNVWWYNNHPDECDHGQMWDQTIVHGWFDNPERFAHYGNSDRFEYNGDKLERGVIVVVAGKWHANEDDYHHLSVDLAPYPRVWLIVTSDEESTFDPAELVVDPDQPRATWLQIPRSDGPTADRYFGFGPSPQCRPTLGLFTTPAHRRLDVFLSAQNTHQRRHDCFAAFAGVSGLVEPSPGFTQGLDPADYHACMSAAKVAPCPSGPTTPDSFRAWEALEAGVIPILDRECIDYETNGNYWPLLFGGTDCPLPSVSVWASAPDIARLYLDDDVYLGVANQVSAWYQLWKRDQVSARDDLLTSFGETVPERPITVLVPTSPSPLHPSTDQLYETVGSVLERLPAAEVLIMADGVREEQESHRDTYESYLEKVLWRCNHDLDWANVYMVRFDEHHHQGRMLKATLPLVRTPLVLYVEHDTPLEGDIPFDQLACVLQGDDGPKVIRLSHESEVLAPHEHLMLDRWPLSYPGCREAGDASWDTVPLVRTVQWSQRPHIARTDAYSDWAGLYFGEESSTMIEDVMHGVVQEVWRTRGYAGWERFGLYLYHPTDSDGRGIRRTYHLDGRRDDPKFDMVFEYDGDKPEGAPAPMSGRLD